MLTKRALLYFARAFYRKWGLSLLTLLTAGLLAILSANHYSAAGNRLRLEIPRLQSLFEWRGPLALPENVIVASIDGQAVMELANGARVFPRRPVALAVQRLVEAAPRLVILDLRAAPENTDPEANDILERALASGPTVLAGGRQFKEGESFCEREVHFAPSNSDPRFTAAAKRNIKMWTLETFGQHMLLSLCDDPKLDLATRVPLSEPLQNLARYKIVDPGLDSLINFHGPAGSMPRVSLTKVLSATPEELRKLIHNKVVLVGYLYDENRGMNNNESFVVPASRRPMFGVEIHANIVSNLIHNSPIQRFDSQSEWLLICAFILVVSAFGLRMSPERGIPFLLLGWVAYYGVGVLFFNYASLLLPGTSVVTTALIVAALLSLLTHYNYIKVKLKTHLEALGLGRDRQR